LVNSVMDTIIGWILIIAGIASVVVLVILHRRCKVEMESMALVVSIGVPLLLLGTAVVFSSMTSIDHYSDDPCFSGQGLCD